jgi:transposase
VIPAHVRIFVCTEPVDMRRSFDGLALVAQQRLEHDPRRGGLFVFTNRRANRLKVLWFDDNGYCLLYKRLHRAIFRMPAASDAAHPRVCIDATALAELLRGVVRPQRARATNISPINSVAVPIS